MEYQGRLGWDCQIQSCVIFLLVRVSKEDQECLKEDQEHLYECRALPSAFVAQRSRHPPAAASAARQQGVLHHHPQRTPPCP